MPKIKPIDWDTSGEGEKQIHCFECTLFSFEISHYVSYDSETIYEVKWTGPCWIDDTLSYRQWETLEAAQEAVADFLQRSIDFFISDLCETEDYSDA